MLAQIQKNQLQIKNNAPLVQGTVGAQLEAAFSEDWESLAIVAVFASGSTRRDVVVDANDITIPWELLSEADHDLLLNFHGSDANGRIVLRTNIVSLGRILPSNAPSGQEPDAPSPSRADQIQALAESAAAHAAESLSLVRAMQTEGGIRSGWIDSYRKTWNLWDGSWGLSKANPVTGVTLPYIVCGPEVTVNGGQYYSIGVLENPLYETLVKILGVYWYDADGNRLRLDSLSPGGAYVKWIQAPSEAVTAVAYFNSNDTSVSISVEQIQAADYHSFFAARLVNFLPHDSSGRYRVTAEDWLPSYLLDEASIGHAVTHIVTVGASSANFTSLRDALDTIRDYGFPSETNRYEVQIQEGTYDIASYYTSDEKAASNYIGLVVPDWVTLKGVGSRKKTILQYVLDEPSSLISVLNLQNTCALENLTLYGVKTRYCVHDDKGNDTGAAYTRYCKNVHFKGDTMTYGAVYGAGIMSNAVWTFEDCIFESLTEQNYQNCFAVHGSPVAQTGSSTVRFLNCRFIGHGSGVNNALILSTLANTMGYYQNYCELRGCHANGRLILREESAALYGSGCSWWATGYAASFTDTVINITDGQDYSDHIDLI